MTKAQGYRLAMRQQLLAHLALERRHERRHEQKPPAESAEQIELFDFDDSGGQIK